MDESSRRTDTRARGDANGLVAETKLELALEDIEDVRVHSVRVRPRSGGTGLERRLEHLELREKCPHPLAGRRDDRPS